MDKKIAIIAIARLENDYINEWIGHHLNIGVNHIYVYDNSSSEEEKLHNRIYEKYLDMVTVIPAYNKVQFQMPAYKESYQKYGSMYDYLIYIDIDEFIMLQKDKTIQEFVNRFPDDCECYRMNWMIYGDNDIINRDVSSSIVNDFTKPVLEHKRNNVTKSIIKGGLSYIDFISVHYAIINNDGVKSNLNTYYGDMINITSSLPINSKSLNIHRKDYTYVQLNHYITKSLCEFICQKMRRPDAAWNYERNIDKDFFVYNIKTLEKEKTYESSKNEITYYYFTPKKFENAGDYFNKILVNKLYHCVCKPINSMSSICDVAFCGSVLTNKGVTYSKYIVGCGFQNNNEVVNKNPNSYLAVRGKLTKDRLVDKGIQIKDDIKLVDPGLLVSKIYDFVDVKKKYKIGIIPHYVDENMVVNRYGSKYRIISMKTSDVQGVCKKIKECDIILSSSLHGIIFSHSLGVPAYHIELSKLQDGDNFKFKDYYSSYESGINYKFFKCVDYNIPFEDILDYDKNNRYICNPKRSDVLKKQKDFISVLPFKEYLNEKYTYVETPNDVIPVEITSITNIQQIKHTTLSNRIAQLRGDIATGKVVKVPVVNGFVWKRIK